MSNDPLAKLQAALPGATLERVGEKAKPYAKVGGIEFSYTAETWQVVRGGNVLATGCSEREAVDRAVFLWGQQAEEVSRVG